MNMYELYAQIKHRLQAACFSLLYAREEIEELQDRVDELEQVVGELEFAANHNKARSKSALCKSTEHPKSPSFSSS